MSTVNNITDTAYLKCGMRTPDAGEDAEALEALNNMIGIWSIEFTVPFIIRENFPLVAGTAEYTIGTDGDFNTVRPISIENAYLKDTDGYSYPLKVVAAKDYNRIGIKTLEGRPKSLYFYPKYPLAKIIFNKEADVAYTAFFEFIKHLTEFTAITDTVTLPNEYKEALVYNLAVRLAENNAIQLIPTVITLAGLTYSALLNIAAVNKLPPRARFDFGGGRPSNIITGE